MQSRPLVHPRPIGWLASSLSVSRYAPRSGCSKSQLPKFGWLRSNFTGHRDPKSCLRNWSADFWSHRERVGDRKAIILGALMYAAGLSYLMLFRPRRIKCMKSLWDLVLRAQGLASSWPLLATQAVMNIVRCP